MAKRSGNGDVGEPTQEKLDSILARGRAQAQARRESGERANRVQKNLTKRNDRRERK